MEDNLGKKTQGIQIISPAASNIQLPVYLYTTKHLFLDRDPSVDHNYNLEHAD